MEHIKTKLKLLRTVNTDSMWDARLLYLAGIINTKINVRFFENMGFAEDTWNDAHKQMAINTAKEFIELTPFSTDRIVGAARQVYLIRAQYLHDVYSSHCDYDIFWKLPADIKDYVDPMILWNLVFSNAIQNKDSNTAAELMPAYVPMTDYSGAVDEVLGSEWMSHRSKVELKTYRGAYTAFLRYRDGCLGMVAKGDRLAAVLGMNHALEYQAYNDQAKFVVCKILGGMIKTEEKANGFLTAMESFNLAWERKKEVLVQKKIPELHLRNYSRV